MGTVPSHGSGNPEPAGLPFGADAWAAAQRQRLAAALDLLGAAAFEWDEASGRLEWLSDCPLGEPAPETLEAFCERLEPEDRPKLPSCLRECSQESARMWASCRVRLKLGDGAILRATVRARKLAGTILSVVLTLGPRERDGRTFALERSDRLDRVLRDSALGIAYMDLPSGEIFWSARCKELHGLPADAATSLERYFASVHPDDRARLEREIDEAIEKRRALETVYRTVDAAGRIRWIRKIARPSFDDEGRLARFDGVVIDVTRMVRTERALRGMNLELERRVNARTAELSSALAQLEAFSSTVAHDLRAPLRHLRGYAEVLMAESGARIGERGRDYLKRIVRAAESLDALTRDVLSYNRITSAELRLGQVDLDQLVGDVVSHYCAGFQKPGIEVDSPLGRVVANEAVLTQCLMNLLGNALKFVAPGVAPRVRVRTERRGPALRLWVEDNGIGIDSRWHGKVFEPFERLGRKEYEGTGIGLAIVKKGVARMGGNVGVESEIGRGSRFWIELPAS